MEDWLSPFENKKLAKGGRVSNQQYISTSYTELDYVLGGGFPLGKTVEISGEPGSGKTCLITDIIGTAQKENLSCVYMNIGPSFDMVYAKSRGVKLDELLIFQPEDINKIVEASLILMEQGLADIIVIDSISNIPNVPLKQILNPLLKKIVEYNTCLILASQVRNDLDFGRYKTPFMLELNDIANIRMLLKVTGGIKTPMAVGTAVQDMLIGKKVLVDIYKNDLTQPAQTNIDLYI
jgi:recombination protein RecA